MQDLPSFIRVDGVLDSLCPNVSNTIWIDDYRKDGGPGAVSPLFSGYHHPLRH